jgi:hypothetical protein
MSRKEKAVAVFIRSMRERCMAKHIDQDRPTWGDAEKLLDLLDARQDTLKRPLKPTRGRK